MVATARSVIRPASAYQPVSTVSTDELMDDTPIGFSEPAKQTTSKSVTRTRSPSSHTTPPSFTSRTSILTMINITLFWLLLFELIVKNSTVTISQELWMNAVVRPPGIALLLIWGWAFALGICRQYGLDVERCLLVDPSISRHVTSINERDVLNTALVAAIAFQLNFLSHLYEVLPAPRTLILIVLVAILANPMTWLDQTRQFTIFRCLATIISPFGRVTFREVLLADVLTSLSKTLVDLQAIVCAMLIIGPGNPLLLSPSTYDDCFHSLWAPVVMAMPFLFRFRQCMTRFGETGEWVHIYNAIKYSSSLPVIVLSAIRTNHPDDKALYNLFIIFAAINSTFGFVWDCVFDWGLWTYEQNEITGVSYFGLRGTLSFPPIAYYAVMVLDFVLRFAWLLGFVPMFTNLGREFDLFVFEALEVSRRCVWVVFRVEWEHLVVKAKGVRGDPVAVQISMARNSDQLQL